MTDAGTRAGDPGGGPGASGRPLVVGLGNRDRSDDAVGLVVADRLADQPALDVVAWEGSELDLLDLWRGRDEVVLVDAVVSGRPPGTILDLDAHGFEALAAVLAGGTHGFDLIWVVKLARRLQALPGRLRVVAIEAHDLSPGTGLTSAVAESAEAVVADLGGEVVLDLRTPNLPAPEGGAARRPSEQPAGASPDVGDA